MASARNRRGLRVGVIILALAGVAVGGYAAVRSTGGDPATSGGASSPTATPTQASPSLNPDGSIATPSAEPSLVVRDDPRPSDAGIQVVLTYVGFDPGTGTVQGNGYVAGVLEDGGTCTLTLTAGDHVVTATSEAFADATTTSCGHLETAAEIPPGTYEAVLGFAGSRSDALEVSVP